MPSIELPAAPGITWRVPTLEDVDGLAAHIKRIHDAERLDFVPGADFFRWMFGQDGFEPDTDWRVAIDAEGRVVADGGAWAHVTDRGGRVFLWSETSPGHNDLEAGLLAWAEERGLEQIASTAEGLPRVIRVPTEEHRDRHRKVIEDAGFEVGRSFVTMGRSLDDLPTAPPTPPGIEIVPWSPELDESTRLASNESFADHWGSLPISPSQWASFYPGSPTFRPDLSFLAVTDGQVVSLCLCEVDEDHNAETGRREAFIDRVGTVADHRRKRLASVLLVRAMVAAEEAGFERAALEVDETSHTNATEVYRRLGFEVESRNLHYLREL